MSIYYPPYPSTAARKICDCFQCGGPVYENLVHHCGTVRVGEQVSAQTRRWYLTPWGTWELRW